MEWKWLAGLGSGFYYRAYQEADEASDDRSDGGDEEKTPETAVAVLAER